MTEPTIDEQIAHQRHIAAMARARPDSERQKVNIKAAILASLERLKSLDAQPVAWRGIDLDLMAEAFHRVIEAHANKASPFHNPVDADAALALREFRAIIPALKAYTIPPTRRSLTQPASSKPR